jgi:hypothetical protein
MLFFINCRNENLLLLILTIMKKIIFTLILFTYSIYSFSQSEMSVYSATGRAGVATTFVTDYQAIGINPANLGFGRLNDSKKFTLGVLEFGANIYHEGLSDKDFYKYGVHYKERNTYDKITAAQKFSSNTVSMNIDLTLLGISFQDEKFGGLAFSIRESFRYYSKLDPGASEYIFRGATSAQFDSLTLSNGTTVPNDPNQYSNYTAFGDSITGGKATVPFAMAKVLGNSKIKQHWYRDYAVSYGRKIVDNNGMQLYIGVGAKYVAGYNYINIESDGNTVKGNIAVNPLTDPLKTIGTTSPSLVNNTNYQSIGKGYGFDLGVTLLIKQRYKFGIAATNFGSVTYDKNVYSLKDTVIATVEYNEKEGFKSVGDIAVWEGRKKLKVDLPAMLRAGASMTLMDYRMEIGFDAIIPLNDAAGNLSNVLVGIGGDYKILKTIKIATGFNMGGNTSKKFNLPLGVTFSIKNTVEFGVASRDVLSYFLTTGNSYSLAAGVFRWRL